MAWFPLDQHQRLRHEWHRCASEGCDGIPTSRLEVDGVGSIYCSNCRAAIEVADDARNYGVGFTRKHPDGQIERIPPEQVIIHGNTISRDK